MRLGVVGAVVAVASVVSGCAAAAAEAGVTAQKSQQTQRAVPEYCSIEYKTVVTATEAFWAMDGEYPQNQSELVEAGLLRDVIDDFELTIAGDDYTVVAVERCEGFDPDASYADLEPETTPAPEPTSDTTSEAAACETDLRTLQVAWEAFNIDYGRPPESESELVEAGFLRMESSGYDLVGGEFVAVPGVCG